MFKSGKVTSDSVEREILANTTRTSNQTPWGLAVSNNKKVVEQKSRVVKEIPIMMGIM